MLAKTASGDSESSSASLLQSIARLRDVLVERATGPKTDSAEFLRLRLELLRASSLRSVLPSYLRDCRNLDEFFQLVRGGRPTYAERRAFIWQSLRPAFEVLEKSELDGDSTMPESNGAGDAGSAVFISYSSVDKHVGGQVQRLLFEFGVSSFLAHETIEVSEDWRQRILSELNTCGVFVPILSESFLKSVWTQQEVGSVVLRPEVTIAPISIDGTKPPGFLSNLQCAFVPSTGLSAELLIQPLVRRCPRIFVPGLIERVSMAPNFREGEARLRWLRPAFDILTPTELSSLVDVCLDNGQVYDAHDCRSVLFPELLRVRGEHIHADKRERLRRLSRLG